MHTVHSSAPLATFHPNNLLHSFRPVIWNPCDSPRSARIGKLLSCVYLSALGSSLIQRRPVVYVRFSIIKAEIVTGSVGYLERRHGEPRATGPYNFGNFRSDLRQTFLGKGNRDSILTVFFFR